MKNKDLPPTKEEKIARVDEWIRKMVVDDEGQVEVSEIDKQTLRDVLTYYGADFEPKPGMEKLRQKTNLHRRAGMNAVWGENYMDNFNRWTTKFANAFEVTGRKLPKLKKSGNRTSGMRHFLGHITAYAAGEIKFKTLKTRMKDRLVNGWAYQAGEERKEVDWLPDNKKLPGSIPPGYVGVAWGVIKSRELEEKVPDVDLSGQSAV